MFIWLTNFTWLSSSMTNSAKTIGFMLWASRWRSRQSPWKKMFFLWCSVFLLKGFWDDNMMDNEVARYSGESARDWVHQLKLLCNPVKGCTGSLPDWKRYLSSLRKGYFRWWQLTGGSAESEKPDLADKHCLGFAVSSFYKAERKVVLKKTVSPFVPVSDCEFVLCLCEPTYVSASSL